MAKHHSEQYFSPFEALPLNLVTLLTQSEMNDIKRYWQLCCRQSNLFCGLQIPLLRPPFGLPKSGLIREVVLISNIIS